jgi:hypothetical protein
VLIEKEGPSSLSLEAKVEENGKAELDPWMLYLYSHKIPGHKREVSLATRKIPRLHWVPGCVRG